MIQVESELVLLRLSVVTGDSSREIFFLGIVRGIPEEKTAVDDVGTEYVVEGKVCLLNPLPGSLVGAGT